MKAKVMFARFPFKRSEDPAVAKWLVPTVLKCKNDGRVGEVLHLEVDDTPITMSRNRACRAAQKLGVDILCMIDSDMQPDLPGQRPFWDTSFEFMLRHEGPCCVAAPYCGPPPHENVYVFRWATYQGDHPNTDLHLEQYPREDACQRAGFEEVGALPTGLMLIDMRALDVISPPWFEYEYKDPPFNTEKSTTEDVFFTRNLSLAGVPQYVNWDAWAGHVKMKVVGKPSILTCDAIREQFREAVSRNAREGEKIMDINCGVPRKP